MAEFVQRAKQTGAGSGIGATRSVTRLLMLAAAVVASSAAACSSPTATPFAPSGSNCNTAGTWAIFVEVGVEWQSGVISPGAGTVKQWILSQIAIEPDGSLRSQAHACGIGAQNVPLGSPWFSTIAVPSLQLDHEWTGVQFLPALFDDGTLDNIAIPVQISSSNPLSPSIGDDFQTQAAPFIFGLRGLDPVAPWPTAEEVTPLLFDADQDGFPGITGLPFQGQVPGEAPGVQFKDPRLTIQQNPPPRASKLFLALRTRAALEGKLTSCEPTPRLEGQVIPQTLLVETRNVACMVDGTNQYCDATQSKFIDDNLPAFNPNGTSRFVGLKVRDNITCPEVRAMNF